MVFKIWLDLTDLSSPDFALLLAIVVPRSSIIDRMIELKD